MITRRALVGVALLFSLTIFLLPVRAAPTVGFRAFDLGGGLFEYDLTLDNGGGLAALSGWLVVHGDTVFGLDNSSVIVAPVGWSYVAPLPFAVDPLFYFAQSPASDLPIDEVLTGFSFQSIKDPASLGPSDFEIIGIDAALGTQIPLGDAQLVPEPGSALLVTLGLAAALAARRVGLESHSWKIGSSNSIFPPSAQPSSLRQ